MKTSESIKELATALCNVQAALEPARFNANNPFFKSKYADLNSVYDACRHLMADNGLSLVQFPSAAPIENGPAVALTSRLMHQSGEWLEETMIIPLAKATPQDYGSALTYARRYAVSAIIGIVADEDDDANQAQSAHRPKAKPAITANQQKPSDDQMKQFHAAGTAVYGDEWSEKRAKIVEYVTDGRTSSSKHLTLDEWQKALNGIKAKADAAA